jgi:hypothetical protein
MMTPLSHGPRLLTALAAAAALAACTQVIETVPFEPVEFSSAPTRCHSALGYYFLPRALLNVKATSDPVARTRTLDLGSVPTTIADTKQAFCLDYLASPQSIDLVVVDRSPLGLLQRINSNVEDRTPQIAQMLIQTAENLAIAGRAAALPNTQSDSLNIQFDPFNYADMVETKKALRRFGFCIYVEGYSFPSEGLSNQQIRAGANDWCSSPIEATPFFEHPLLTFAKLPVPPEAMRRGVLYRPKSTHNIVILRRKDPAGGPWELFQTKRFELPNASPVLSIGIERALFTTRVTTVNFNDGTLTDVAVDKDSEAVGFVTIPLAAAKAITEVPSQIVKFRIADTQSHAALINAQGNLLKALADYNALVHPPATTGLGGAMPKSAIARSGQFIGGCLDANGPAAACANLANGIK